MTETAERPRNVWWLVAPIIVLVICAQTGDALTTTWADEHPLLLIMLNARSRILVLVTNQLDPPSFYLVAAARLLISDPLFYLLGRWHGDAAVAWVERKAPTFGEQLRGFEKVFAKAAYPIVFLAPNNYICMFAGASGMRPSIFITLNVAGTFARLYLIRRVGETFEAPIDDVLGFFGRYTVPLLILSVALVALVVIKDRKQGTDDLTGLRELAEEEPTGPASHPLGSGDAEQVEAGGEDPGGQVTEQKP